MNDSRSFEIDDIQLDDILLTDIKVVEYFTKAIGYNFRFAGIAKRGDQERWFSFASDYEDALERENIRKDLYESIDVPMRYSCSNARDT